VRMARHSENALKVAEFLKKHPRSLGFAILDSKRSTYAKASRYLKNGFAAWCSGQGGYDAAVRSSTTSSCSHTWQRGDAKSLILHPASTSHSQLTEEQQKSSG